METPRKGSGKRKFDDDDDTEDMSAFVVKVSPIQYTKKGGTPFFDGIFQTGDAVFNRGVIYAPEQHRNFLQALEKRSPVKLRKVGRMSSRDFSVSSEVSRDFDIKFNRRSVLSIVASVPFARKELTFKETKVGEVSIADIAQKDVQSYVTVSGKVMEVVEEEAKVQMKNEVLKKKSWRIADESGCIKLCLWADQIGMVESKKCYKFEKVGVRDFNGLHLTAGKGTKITLVEDIVEVKNVEKCADVTSEIELAAVTKTWRCNGCNKAINVEKEERFVRCSGCGNKQVTKKLKELVLGKLTLASGQRVSVFGNVLENFVGDEAVDLMKDTEALEEHLLTCGEVLFWTRDNTVVKMVQSGEC